MVRPTLRVTDPSVRFSPGMGVRIGKRRLIEYFLSAWLRHLRDSIRKPWRA
jgi:hypothetical protein